MKTTTLLVPADHVDEVLGLFDALHIVNAQGAGNQALFRLWTKLGQIFPKQDFKQGAWRLDRKHWCDVLVTDEPEPAPRKLKIGDREVEVSQA